MFGRSTSVRLCTVSGIRIGVSASWFIVLFLMIYLLSRPFRETLGSSDLVAYLTTVAAVLALFASIIVHELGHALAARRRGVGVSAIDLYLFGGLTQMDREPATAGEDFAIAVAGPLATVAVILVCLGVDFAIVGGHRLGEAITLDAGVRITPVLLALSWLIPTNVLLLAFNLLPAVPLDGGRIARSVVWRITGERYRAALAAARLGQLLALLMAAFGFFLLIDLRSWAGLYSLGLAWILYSSARGAIARAGIDERLDGVCVADIMDAGFADHGAIAAELGASEALTGDFRRHRSAWLPVVDGDGRFLGIVRRDDAQAALDAGEGWVRIGSLVGEDPQRWQIAAERPITELFGSTALSTLGAAMVVDETGVLRGVVTVEQLRRALAAAIPA